MTMLHADNKDLVLPVNVASIQAIILPFGLTFNELEENDQLFKYCKSIEVKLKLYQKIRRPNNLWPFVVALAKKNC